MVYVVGRGASSRRGRGSFLSRLLLDTTFLVDAQRSQTNLDAVIEDEDDVAIAAITVAELLVGVELAIGKTARRRQELIEEIVESIPILDYDLTVARTHAQLLALVRQQGRPRGAHDLIIAATALASNRSLVTADESGFVNLNGLVTVMYR